MLIFVCLKIRSRQGDLTTFDECVEKSQPDCDPKVNKILLILKNMKPDVYLLLAVFCIPRYAVLDLVKPVLHTVAEPFASAPAPGLLNSPRL